VKSDSAAERLLYNRRAMGDEPDTKLEGPPAGFERAQLTEDEIGVDEATEQLFKDDLGRMDRWALLNVVKALQVYVGDGEQLLGLAAPMFDGTMGLLAVTDRQLVFLLQRSHPDDEELVVDRLQLPYASIVSAGLASVVDLEIGTAERQYVFRGKAKQMKEIAGLIAERTPEAAAGSDPSE
jgi:hypothetical protein